MEGGKSIRQEIGEQKYDTLRFGLQSVRGEIVGDHPLEVSRQSAQVEQHKVKRQMLSNIYGAAMPMKMELDQQILARSFQRPPGAIPSSFLGLEATTGALDDFGFDDYLNNPTDSESFAPADLHYGMEVRLGMTKGPVLHMKP